MSTSDKVSIGFLVFNDAAFLRRALDSLLQQTYQNLEIVIGDDGSSDGSQEICREYAKVDTRISYHRHSANIGISRNMAYVLAEAKGEYFMWAADDDYWHPTFVEKLLAALRSRPDCIVAFCSYQLVDEDDQALEGTGPRTIDYSGPDPGSRIRKLVVAWDDGFGYGLFRRRLIQDVRFPVWWWINARSPRNNIYPTLFHYLARADFVLVEGPPLWFNRIKRSPNHGLPFGGAGARGIFASLLRQINLHAKCVEAVARGSGSVSLALGATPLLLRRFGGDVAAEAIAFGRQMASRSPRSGPDQAS